MTLASARAVLDRDRMRSEESQNEIAHRVIGCSMTVHRRIGPGCFESAYAPCLAHELARCGLRFEVDVMMDLIYDELTVPRAYRIDFIVEDCVVLELKALEQTGRVHGPPGPHLLKTDRIGAWTPAEFRSSAMRDGVERVVNNFPGGT